MKKINKLVKDIQRDTFKGTGHPEALTGNLSEWWSRRMDEKNRIVYQAVGENTIILSRKGHYSDK